MAVRVQGRKMIDQKIPRMWCERVRPSGAGRSRAQRVVWPCVAEWCRARRGRIRGASLVASMTRHCALPEAIVGTLVVGLRADMAARWLPEPAYRGRESSVVRGRRRHAEHISSAQLAQAGGHRGRGRGWRGGPGRRKHTRAWWWSCSGCGVNYIYIWNVNYNFYVKIWTPI
jgi:hypothetical protein